MTGRPPSPSRRRPARGPAAPASLAVGGRRAVLEAVRAGVAREVLVGRGNRERASLREVVDACRALGVPIRATDRRELDALAADHQGVVARVVPAEPIGERELASHAFGEDDIVVVLDGVTDPQNLGAAARSAEAAGATMLVTRTRRAADVTPAAVRASAGALLHLSHARVANIPRALERLRRNGFTIVGLSERADRTIFEERCPEGPVALVLGDEGTGLARLTVASCDLLVRLPMAGRIASLNAAASLAAALYGFVLPSRNH